MNIIKSLLVNMNKIAMKLANNNKYISVINCTL